MVITSNADRRKKHLLNLESKSSPDATRLHPPPPRPASPLGWRPESGALWCPAARRPGGPALGVGPALARWCLGPAVRGGSGPPAVPGLSLPSNGCGEREAKRETGAGTAAGGQQGDKAEGGREGGLRRYALGKPDFGLYQDRR